MKAHRGQVAVYLAFVLVAIVFLVLMNVDTFLCVSARNKAMNGGDAAALAVARYQGELLNQIGAANIEHLKRAVYDDSSACEHIVNEQKRLAFLGPLDGIRRGNEVARENGCKRSDAMRDILKRHVDDIRLLYLNAPESYPEPWPGAWCEYAENLEIAIGKGIWAGPDNIYFLGAASGHLLVDRYFYAAIAGRNWCWFRQHAPGILTNYDSFRNWGPLPTDDAENRREKCVNSEIYSLGLTFRKGSAVEMLGYGLISKLTGASVLDMSASKLLHDHDQEWVFFGESFWRPWTEMSVFGEEPFPAIGKVKREFDVRGCAAICRVEAGGAVWSAAAKPFGTVVTDNETDVVTAFGGFLTDAFEATRLVPLDSVGGKDLSTADPVWMEHISRHLSDYYRTGPNRLSECFYCEQLVWWEKPTFRAQGASWLKYHANSCRRYDGPGSGRGGSAHGH